MSDDRLSLPVSKNREKTFKGISAVERFLETERESFSWLTSKNDWRNNKASEVSNSVSRAFNKIQNAIDGYEGNKVSLKRVFENLYMEKGMVYSKSEAGRYIGKVRKKKDDEYAAIFYYYVSDIISSPTINDFRAGFEAAQFRSGRVSKELSKESIAELKEEWDKRFSKLLGKADGEIENMKSSLEDTLKRKSKKYSREIDRLVERKENFEKEVKEKVESIEETNKRYREQISMMEPVKYWKKKAKGHLITSSLLGFATMCGAIAVGLLFAMQAGEILGPDRQPNYAQLVVLLTIATLGVWGLRVLVRLFFSQVHLYNDAFERSVMLQSFLAMLSEDHVADDDKDKILSALFRPAQSGVGKQDSAPLNAASILSELGFKR